MGGKGGDKLGMGGIGDKEIGSERGREWEWEGEGGRGEGGSGERGSEGEERRGEPEGE